MATTNEAPRAWQRMLSGRRLDLLDPSPMDIEIGDIAHGLARVARWNGQTQGEHAFSVAQHSVLVAQVVGQMLGKHQRESQLYALLHDAPEYVIGDMISPFKAVMGGAYKDVETRLEAAVHVHLGLPAHPSAALKKTIKKADRVIAFFEATTLAGFNEVEARSLFGNPANITKNMLDLSPWPTAKAQTVFLDAITKADALP